MHTVYFLIGIALKYTDAAKTYNIEGIALFFQVWKCLQ
jgi:hypothetical protein